MLKKNPSHRPSKSIQPIHRFGLLLLALLVCLGIFGNSLFLPSGIVDRTGRSWAQTSESVFGVEANPLDATGGLSLITQTQSAWVRGPDVFWNEIESTPGVYDWTAMTEATAEVQNAVTNGLEPIVVVTGTPAWAQKYPGYICGPIDSADFNAFANFMVQLITNSPITAYNVKYWELWNEPDLGWSQVPTPNYPWAGCWGETGDTQYFGGSYYGEMLKVVYPKIKAVNSQAQVLVGGLLLDCDPYHPPAGKNCTSSKFLEGILVNNGAGSFDGVSYHAYDYYGGSSGTYANSNWNSAWDNRGPSLIEKSNYLRQLLSKYNASSKYLLNTENALLCDSCTDDPVFETTKSYYVAEAYASAMAQNLRANIWFSMLGEWGRNNGLMEFSQPIPVNPPLPAYFAYKFAAQELSGASFIGNVTSFQRVSGYEFSKGDRHVWLMWVPDGGNVTVDLRATPSNVYDVDGDPVTFSGTRLVVNRQPYYVELPASLPRLNFPVLSNNFYVLSNGNFEENQAGWTFLNNGLPASTVAAHPVNPTTGAPDTAIPAGTRSALLGNPDYPCSSTGVPLGNAEIKRVVTVPDNPNKEVWLDFNYIIYSQDASTSVTYDRFEVYVQDTGSPALLFADGNMVSSSLSCSKWRRVPGPDNPRDGITTGWALGSIDLTAYKGHNITISFQNWSRFDNYYNTYTYLDNINLRQVAVP